jgi:hypothetical protein
MRLNLHLDRRLGAVESCCGEWRRRGVFRLGPFQRQVCRNSRMVLMICACILIESDYETRSFPDGHRARASNFNAGMEQAAAVVAFHHLVCGLKDQMFACRNRVTRGHEVPTPAWRSWLRCAQHLGIRHRFVRTKSNHGNRAPFSNYVCNWRIHHDERLPGHSHSKLEIFARPDKNVLWAR